jgi:hypothetical protein
MCSAWSETREGALLTMRHHQAGSRSLSLAPLWERVDRRRAAKRRRDGCGIAEFPDVMALTQRAKMRATLSRKRTRKKYDRH